MRDNSKGIDEATRRRFLRTSGALATTSFVAGCSGDGGSDGESGDGGSDGESGDGGSDGESGDGGSESDFPNDSISFIVPYGPGGGFDFYTRIVAKYIARDEYLGVETNVTNVEGSGGITGANQIYNAEPNGYTLGIWYPPGLASYQITRPDAVQYEMTELTPMASAAGTTRALAVREDSDIENFQQFVEAANNGDMQFAATGRMNHGRKQIAALAEIAGVLNSDVLDQFVYFDGKSDWFTAMQRGDVDYMGATYSSLLPFVGEGLRVILVYTENEEPPEQTPDAQTLADIDLPNQQDVMGFIASTPVYRCLVGPPDIPDARAEILQEAILSALESSELQEEAAESDRPVSPADAETVDEWLDTYVETQENHKDLLEQLRGNS